MNIRKNTTVKTARQCSFLLLFATAALVIGGCKEKKQPEENVITTHYVPQRPQGPIAMPADSQTVSVTWLGRPYSVTIMRTPIDSITVADDSGQKYIDNNIRLTIAREDGSVFLSKTFTKRSFSSYIQEPFTTSGILAGIRYDETAGSALEFSVAVAMPEAADDLYIPLDMTIDSQGGVSIRKDDDMGMKDYDGSLDDFSDSEEEE